jgi:hypothetical protein
MNAAYMRRLFRENPVFGIIGPCEHSGNGVLFFLAALSGFLFGKLRFPYCWIRSNSSWLGGIPQAARSLLGRHLGRLIPCISVCGSYGMDTSCTAQRAELSVTGTAGISFTPGGSPLASYLRKTVLPGPISAQCYPFAFWVLARG